MNLALVDLTLLSTKATRPNLGRSIQAAAVAASGALQPVARSSFEAVGTVFHSQDRDDAQYV